MNKFVKQLEKVTFPTGLTLHYDYFGSFLNGFGTKSSDVDFTILTNSYFNEKAMLSSVYKQLKAKGTLSITISNSLAYIQPRGAPSLAYPIDFSHG